MERARERDDLYPLWLVLVIEVLARHFHGQLTAFGARVGEKYRVRKSMRDQLIGQRLLLRNFVQVGGVPKRACLICQRCTNAGFA